MGRKNVVKSYPMFNNTDISINQTSPIVNVINLDKASIHVEWTGTTPIGVMTVEARNGKDDTWYDLDFSGQTIDITGNTGDHQILMTELPFTDIRLQYVVTSGTGSLEARISAKVTGA